MKTKILSILALLLMTVTQGAGAQTTADIGRVIAADGKMYKTVTLANKVSTASGVVAYVGSTSKCVCPDYPDDRVLVLAVNNTGNQAWGSTGCTHGGAHNTVASALTHLSGNMTTYMLYNEHISTSDGHHTHLPAYQCRTLNVAKPSGAHEWFWPSVGQWNLMVKGLTGSYADLSETVQSALTAVLNGKIQAAGAEAVPTGNTILSTSYDGNEFWEYSGSGRLYHIGKSNAFYFRAMFTMPASATNGYVVEYDANNGSGAPSAQSKTHGTALTLSSTVPTRTGYTFAGWNTKADGSGKSYSAGGSYTTNDDIVLYAQWFVGEGTEASPYLIANTTDWNNLSAAVNGGETYSGKYFKMTANVGTVSTTVGTSASRFNGTFDGNGHTLTVNISNSNADTRTAPFAWAGGSAVIKNLHVTGSLTNTARTSGIVGTCDATTQISSCRVSATISGGNHTSGISISGGQITNCLFDGKINGTDYTAGFATHVADGTKITNCLFKPQDNSSIPSNQGCFYTSSSGKTPTLTNCYYTSLANGVAQGTDGSGMTAEQLVQNLGASNWKVVNGNAIPKVHPNLSGEGTQDSPYLIASTTDWNNLVSAVNAGEAYSGNYFQMTANVGTVSTWMTGTFSGTFDGDGNTLTVGYSTSARYCAPFGTLGGTVKNLRVDGTVSTSADSDDNSGKNFGGIAAQVTSGKTATIQNCRVSATLTSTRSGDTSSGGFVGVVWNGGTLNMTGCAFTGSLQGSGATACGGFLGYKEDTGTCSMTDCLFAPASVTMSTLYAGTFSRPSAPTMTRCYFTRTFGGAQGMQARTIAAGDYVSTLSVTKGSGTEYTVSGITVYSGGIDFNDGSTTTFYGGSGQTVSLDLTAETRTGYQFKQYAASQGTLSGQTTNTPTLTMPAANSTANDVVTISAEYDPLYNADFASGNDNDGWNIDPTSGVEGTTVTVSYTGENKVKSVTVTKLALCSLSEVTSEHVGKIIGADGNVYASLAQAEKVTSAVGVLGKVTETGHGLIMSLEDAPQQVWATIDGWASASYAGTTLKVLPDDDARGSNLPSYTTLGSTTVSNWAVATRADYTAIFTNLGSTRSDSDGITYDEHVNAYITSAGGTEISGENWSITQYDSTKAWRFSYSNYWGGRDKTTQYKVRPVLGF